MSMNGTRNVLHAFVLAGSVALGALSPKMVHADNLADAMIGAYQTSGLLEQNRALLRVADEDVANVVSLLRPIVDWVTRGTNAYTRDHGNGLSNENNAFSLFTGLRVQQIIFDNGVLRLTKLQAQEAVLSTRQTLISFEQSILFRAVQAYNNLLFSEENVRLRQNNLRLLQEEQRAAEDRFEVGEVTRTDVALAESRVAAAVANLTTARGQVINARAEYANAVGREPGPLAGQHALPKRPASLSDAVAIAVRNHPAILSEQHNVAATEYGIESARKELGPSANLQVDLGVRAQNNVATTRDSVTTSITLVQPLYAGGGLASDVRRAVAIRDAARANLLTIQRDVIQSVKNAFVGLEVARANIVSTGERIRAAQIAFDGIREEATLGARTTLDVLQAEQELLDAKTAEINAQATQAIAAYQLLAAQGLLTAERLGLAVQIYDPTLYYNLVKSAPAQQSKQSRELDRVLEALGKK
jgi:outer membrane protein